MLTGLLRCHRCGRKVTVSYTGRGRDMLRYVCVRGQLDQGEPKCIAFGGTSVDEQISREVLSAVAPAAVEVAVLASQQVRQQHDDVRDALE